jgi:methionine aminopeptidase
MESRRLSLSVSDYFLNQDIENILFARDQTQKILDEIISVIKPGLRESEVYAFAKDIYRDYGIVRSWHNPYIRFGTNTGVTYKDRAVEDILLKDDDIAFVDIGPLIGEVEGDLGVTLVFGNNEKLYSLKSASEKLFAYGLEFFKSHEPTGIEMQEFISSKAREMGYISLLESTGHLIGNFSHSAIWNQGVATYTEKMQSGVWILEVQIKDPELPYGAFYENILI